MHFTYLILCPFFERSFLDKGISMKIVHYTIVDSVWLDSIFIISN